MCSAEPPSTRESIVGEAMRTFAERGIGATSLREVAKASGVSPALIVHHFGGKDGLIAAVDEAAVYAFGRAYAAEESAGGPALLRERAEQTARVMRERPEVCDYLGRAMVEHTAGGAALFRLMVDGGRTVLDSMVEKGAVRQDTDRLWATLQHFFLIWAPLSFRALLEQEVLEGSLLDEENLRRWVEANVELLKRGIYRDG